MKWERTVLQYCEIDSRFTCYYYALLLLVRREHTYNVQIAYVSISCLKVGLSRPQTDIMTEMDRTDRFPSRFIVSQETDRLAKIPVGSGLGKVGRPDRLHSLTDANADDQFQFLLIFKTT